MSDLYILKDGEPVSTKDVIEWGRWFEDSAERRRVDRTEIGDVTVSTVFLGLDHSWGEGPPLLYETMVFGGDHDGEQDRYSTREEAEAGHARIVETIHRPAATAPTEER